MLSGSGDLQAPSGKKSFLDAFAIMEKAKISDLEQKLAYEFVDRNLLLEALSHRSFVNEHPEKNLRDNERFEFLGDAVLNLVVGHILIRKFPQMNEGDLSRTRASLVNESSLAKIARALNLGSFIRLGKGEKQSNGREKKSILADTYEALVAAVYLDRGLDAAFRIIEKNYHEFLDSLSRPILLNDYKSRLQEVVQVSHRTMPVYEVIEESGPDHDKTFKVAVNIGDLKKEGIGKSKKTAEQHAASKALKALKADSDPAVK